MTDICPGGVLILVDDKKRDLAVAALIAHHLQRLGIPAYLEPLEAFKAGLWAYRPRLILFNHLLASHLVKYSKDLHALGVLTAVLPNEGIMYEEDERRFNAGKSHSGAHIDQFFCWHRLFKEALLETGFKEPTEIHVVGIPRFDFYFEPWSRLWFEKEQSARSRPRLLVATNFGLAHFMELPREQADKFFSAWSDRIKGYDDYWGAIEIHYRSRQRLRDYLRPVLASGRFDVVLRPHPREAPEFYQQWIDSLPPEEAARIQLDLDRNITTAILDCDLEISMDRCTTALESWVARKPTLELVFERHFILSNAEREQLTVLCDEPGRLLPLIDAQLAQPDQPVVAAGRQAHLDLWCDGPDGHSTQKIATAMADILARRGLPEPLPRSQLPYARKGRKLLFLRRFDLPYNWRPWLALRHLLFPRASEMSWRKLAKAIRPSEVRAMLDRLASL